MANQILVTAAMIEDRGKYLITQRPADTHLGGRWEFPGGKVDFGEDPREGLQREIMEELGIKIEVGNLFECSSHVYDGKRHVILLGYHCTYISGEIQKREIDDYAWVTPQEMRNYDIVEADLLFIEKLMQTPFPS